MLKNLIREVDIDTLVPADYNPRVLSNEAQERLKESLSRIGVVKAIIVNKENNTIIAGHQRTKTMRMLGIKKSPAFVLSCVSKQDEIRFNQYHNRCEYEVSEISPKVWIKSALELGWNLVPCKDIVVEDRGKKAAENKILAHLLLKYGTFSNSICTQSGVVFISAGYALASKLCGQDLYVYVVDKEKEQLCKYYFSKDYGAFSYDNINRETYVQSLAQMRRLPQNGKDKKSRLYEDRLIPDLNGPLRGKSILDFGAGVFEYAELLKKRGVDIDYIDPYHSKRRGLIDVNGNIERFIGVCRRIKTQGLYDAVICDSVLNSVDSMEARKSVILSCYALCKVGGYLYVSGRIEPTIPKEKVGRATSAKKDTMYYLDVNGFSATMRDGHWYFQKFDTKEQVEEIGRLFGDSRIYRAGGSWHIVAKKMDRPELYDDLIKGLRFEWDLPLPKGSYGLSDLIENAYRYAVPKN